MVASAKTLLLTVAIALAAAATATATAESDPPTITPWHAIGNISLGEAKARVVYTYGAADQRGGYRVDGGTLSVGYDQFGVNNIYTDSAYYRTPNAFGVGSRVLLGVCHHASGKCVYRWHGFNYISGVGANWSKWVNRGKRRVNVRFWTKQGVVTTIQLVYSDKFTRGFPESS
jgi:hypothetical protein